MNKIIETTKKKIEEKKQKSAVSTNNNEIIEDANQDKIKDASNNLYASLDNFKVPMKSQKLQRHFK